jgi:DNA-binding MarR family transcriptional regulator
MTDRSFTARQGQYLAFIYYYQKINRRSPAEVDIQRYFNVSAPSVHRMVLALEAGGHIERVPGQARSLRVLVAAADLPPLE